MSKTSAKWMATMKGTDFDLSNQCSIWVWNMISVVMYVQSVADETSAPFQFWHTWVIVMRVLSREWQEVMWVSISGGRRLIV
jgi:hypothetical protein